MHGNKKSITERIMCSTISRVGIFSIYAFTPRQTDSEGSMPFKALRNMLANAKECQLPASPHHETSHLFSATTTLHKV